MSEPTISIIFPNANGGNEPLACLSSIARLNYPKTKLEVIVVDNHSADGSPLLIKRKYPHVKLILNSVNLGFAKAVNLGIAQAKGEYIFIGNDDLMFENNSLQILVRYLVNHPRVGLIGGKIFSKDQHAKLSTAGFMMNRWTGHIYSAPNPELVKSPDWLQGCALLTSRKALTQAGLLDPGFSLIYFEDYDLALRIKKSGLQIVYLPQAIFWHGVTKTMNKNLPEKYYQWYKNKFRFVLKNLPWVNVLSIFLIQFLLIVPLRLFLGDGRFIPLLKGAWWNLQHLDETFMARKHLC